MNDLDVNLSVPFPTSKEAEIAYHVLRVDKEPSRSGVTKSLSVKNNTLYVSFTATEARKIRVGLTSFFENLILVTETMDKFGPAQGSYNHF